MKSILYILVVLTTLGCDANVGTKTSDSGNNTDDHSVVNEASECPLCSSEEGLDSLGYDVDFIDCFDECTDFCDGLNADGDPTEELDTCKDCKHECRTMNEESLGVVIDTCRDTYLCTDISDEE